MQIKMTDYDIMSDMALLRALTQKKWEAPISYDEMLRRFKANQKVGKMMRNLPGSNLD